MNYEEFDNTFDVLYNNITSNQAPGLNTYEKSLFLTKAQDEVLKNYFNPKGNKYQEGFDGNAKRQIDFSTLTVVQDYSSFDDPIFDTRDESKSSAFPTDAMMVINEKLTVTRNNKDAILTVFPIAYDEYNRLMSKPYKRPLKHQAWRLINNSTSNKVDLVVGPNDEITEYSVRYVKQPHPIIIGDLDGLSIHGYEWGGTTAPSNPEDDKVYGNKCCELDASIHEEIIQRAIELAKIAWTATGQENAQLVMTAGQRSE